MGLVATALGDLLLLAGSATPGNILAAACFLFGIGVYAVGINIGDTVRCLGTLYRSAIRAAGLLLLIGQLYYLYCDVPANDLYSSMKSQRSSFH